MIGLRLSNGDLAISNNEIEQIEGNELTAQTIQYVLSTNKGEWLFDTDEGINFDNILGKQRLKGRTAADTLYRQELLIVRENENELSKTLEKRLSGE